MDRQNHKPTAQRQTGAALMVSLMILLVLTLIGVTSMSTTILEEKMAGGLRNQNLAFQAAEAALRAGEIWIGAQNQIPNAVASCDTPPCQVMELGSLGDLTTHDDAWWGLNAREYGAEDTQEIDEVFADPRFIVEIRTTADRTGSLARGIAPTRENLYYRLTARGTGGNATTEVILQSHYMVISN